jgi:D-sedoheptulose 7-phosphate isomerase
MSTGKQGAEGMLNEKQQAMLDELITRYPVLEAVRQQILDAYETLEQCYVHGGKLLVAGNGGSCADAEHIVGELMKGFIKRRELPAELQSRICAASADHGERLAKSLQGGLPAIALDNHQGLNTAFSNDVDADMIYAQQVCGYGNAGDVFLGISTSGNSKNVDYAVTVAQAKGLKVIGLTGKDGGRLGRRADVAVIVPEQETFKIQELHLPVYHALCLMLEERFF